MAKPRTSEDVDETLVSGPVKSPSRDTSDALLWGTPYRTISRLGGSDTSELIVADRVATGERVHVKVLRLDFLEGADTVQERRPRGERVRLEAEVLQKLRHPNVCAVLDAGETPDGRPYFVTEPIDGAQPLAALIAEGAFEVPAAISIALDVLAALEAAHALGIVHRDVKPHNILVVEEAGRRVVKLTDFGIAKVVAPDHPEAPAPLARPTAPGERLGTPRYASPELVLGRAIDARSDIYQVGLVLFELCAGRGPFEKKAANPTELLRAHAAIELGVREAPADECGVFVSVGGESGAAGTKTEPLGSLEAALARPGRRRRRVGRSGRWGGWCLHSGAQRKRDGHAYDVRIATSDGELGGAGAAGQSGGDGGQPGLAGTGGGACAGGQGGKGGKGGDGVRP